MWALSYSKGQRIGTRLGQPPSPAVSAGGPVRLEGRMQQIHLFAVIQKQSCPQAYNDSNKESNHVFKILLQGFGVLDG